MWKIVYNVLITLCLPFFLILGLAKQKIRKNLFERLFPCERNTDKGSIWIHAASIGEAMIAENLVRYMHEKNQEEHFLITVNTYYTKDLLQKRVGAHVRVTALPYDLFFSVKRFLNQWKPKALIIVETEIWPNLIWEAKAREIPVIIVNGRISDSTLDNYRKFSFFIRTVLSPIDGVLAQSEEHRSRYIAIGMSPSRVITTGNIKYYRPLEAGNGSTAKEQAITFGSIKEKELPTVYEVIGRIRALFPEYIVFIAPREIHLTGTIEKDLFALPIIRYSTIKQGGTVPPGSIVIVDTIGDLVGIYGRSMAAFVGGSLAPYGGQNILEPLFHQTPVIFGPYMENFRDIADKVLACGGGVQVSTADELLAALTTLLGDDQARSVMGRNGMGVIEEQRQVMERTAGAIANIIGRTSPGGR